MITSDELCIEIRDALDNALGRLNSTKAIREVEYGIIEIHPAQGAISFHASLTGNPNELHPEACTHPYIGGIDKSIWQEAYCDTGHLVIDGKVTNPEKGDAGVEEALFNAVRDRLAVVLNEAALPVRVSNWMFQVGYSSIVLWKAGV